MSSNKFLRKHRIYRYPVSVYYIFGCWSDTGEIPNMEKIAPFRKNVLSDNSNGTYFCSTDFLYEDNIVNYPTYLQYGM